jgi:poly(3-hydroxybutyrate) depolymerase
MRTAFLLAALLGGAMLHAQCDGTRYFNQIFNDYYVTENIVYGSNLNWQGESVDLLLDVYRPYGENQTFERPLVIVVHGGSFLGGSKNEQDVVPISRDLAKMGYVTASINYRLGIDPLGALFNGEVEFTQAVIRGFHDGKAAIRYFRKTVEEDGNPYGIDPNKIFMLGVSAGGFIALHNAYLTDESQIPPVVDQSLPGLEGGIEGNTGHAGYSSALQGVVNIAGAIGDNTWLSAGAAPLLSFHGDQDGTVPYTTGAPLGGLVPITVFGSAPIHEQAESAGLLNCLVTHPGADHVPHVSNAAYYDTTRAITANFLGHLTCPTVPLDCEYREVTLDVQEVENESVKVFPNPARDVLNIRKKGAAGTEVEVYDISGRIVLNARMVGDQHVLPIQHLPAGTYVLRLVSSLQVETTRFIKD